MIAFDTETTGQYPVASEICEIAAVKWVDGREVATFQSFIKPKEKMSDFVIGIHGITNEMVADAPHARDVLPKFLEFIKGETLMAHHAQFDLGFVAAALEENGLPLPSEPTICTSLLGQSIETETENHKLQTLVKHYGNDPGQAHRALDDARACLHVGLKLIEKMQSKVDHTLTLDEICAPMYWPRRRMGKGPVFTLPGSGPLKFSRFSLKELNENPDFAKMIEAIRKKAAIKMVYRGGSRPGVIRDVLPLGVIRQLNGDSLVASEIVDGVVDPQSKRYWLKEIVSIA